MTRERPEENEFLEAVDLSTAPVRSQAKKPRRWQPLLLVLLLLGWSGLVYQYFTREPVAESTEVSPPMSEATQVPQTTVAVKATATPLSVQPRKSKTVEIQSTPAGATVLVDDVFVGHTPLELKDPEIGQQLLFQLSGYEWQRVTLEKSHLQDGLQIELPPLLAKVRIEVQPSGSELLLNGKTLSLPPDGVMLLPLLPQQLRISAPGYQSQTLQFTPAEAYERSIQVSLSPLATPTPAGVVPPILPPGAPAREMVQGLEMLLPGFPLESSLGSPRGSAGHQSNEVEVKVRLNRPFRISKTEISNAQFRKFKPEHNSSRWKGVDLNADTLPVTGISWEDAVAYCNWMSGQEGLPPAYEKVEERWEFREKPGTGYRLPTEAEWESLARLEVKQSLFGWGDKMPPPASTVNIAGKESSKLVPMALETYVDSFAGPAPVEQTGKGPLEILGLYGNVCEWVQDGYSIPPLSRKVQEDPLNAASGKFHVMKGASWQDSGIGNLRIARRRYGNQPAVDLGFRVARYVEGRE